jgi:tRNA pseudouridine13 synthase
MLNGTNSFFPVEVLDEVCERRCQEMDIHPSAPLWGKGASKSQGHPMELEMGVLSNHDSLARGLERSDLKQMRRPLRLLVDGLQWHWSTPQTLVLEFSLLSGCFATSFLREIVDY